MNEIVLVITRAVPRLNRQLQRNAESASDLVNDAKIKPVNMGVGVKRGIGRIRQFHVAMKFAERMKPAIGSRRRKMVRLEIRRSFFNRATGIDGAQTGRKQARGHSPLREDLGRSEQKYGGETDSDFRQLKNQISPRFIVGRRLTKPLADVNEIYRRKFG